jgi:small subunit ribosomal protein S10
MTKIKIYVKAYFVPYINAFSSKIQKAVIKDLNLPIKLKQIFLPAQRETYTILRSPHADKKARDQFERQTYKRLFILDIPVLTKKETLVLQNLIQALNTSAVGVEFRITYETSTFTA